MCWIGDGAGGAGGPATPHSSTTGTKFPAHARSRLPPHQSFAVAGAQRPICAAGSRSRHAAAPDRPATRQAAGRPRPGVVCWPDHNGVGRSATRRQPQVSKGSRHRSSMVSTSLMVDTITVPSRRAYYVPLIERFRTSDGAVSCGADVSSRTQFLPVRIVAEAPASSCEFGCIMLHVIGARPECNPGQEAATMRFRARGRYAQSQTSANHPPGRPRAAGRGADKVAVG